jgi:hypothetical protein
MRLFVGENEFDCVECGRHIVILCGERPDPKLCAACLMLPGWFRDPRVRSILAPEHDGREVCER